MSADIVERLRERHAHTWHSGAMPSIFSAAAAEIERLRAATAAWMNGVADAVEPLGYDREVACGPADLLPGLRDLHALPPGTHRVTVHNDGTVEVVDAMRSPSIVDLDPLPYTSEGEYLTREQAS